MAMLLASVIQDVRKSFPSPASFIPPTNQLNQNVDNPAFPSHAYINKES